MYKFELREKDDEVETYPMTSVFQGFRKKSIKRKEGNVYISEKVKYRIKVKLGESYSSHATCFVPNTNKKSIATFGSYHCSFQDSIRVFTFSNYYRSVKEDVKQTTTIRYDSAMRGMKWTKNKKLWGFGYTVCRNYLILFGGCTVDHYLECFDKIYFYEFRKQRGSGSWNLSVNVCFVDVTLCVYTISLIIVTD